MLKRAARALLDRTPYAVMRRQQLEYQARQQRRLAGDVHSLIRDRVLTDLPDTPRQVDLLGKLIGTYPVSGMFLLDALHTALGVPGAVCEFGVAQGATSALIANELLHHAPDRELWLYDSFQGLPPPTGQDMLVDDLLSLGKVESYVGRFATPQTEVELRLADIGWPATSTHIVAGFFTPQSLIPKQIAFAYVDFDFFEPILNALNAVHSRSQIGTIALVDDYGFFSAGAQRAADEFAQRQEWEITPPPAYLAFAKLQRVA